MTEFLALHQLARYAIFFLVAALCHRHPGVWASMISRYGLWYATAFIASLLLLPEAWLPTVAGLLSVPALVAAARWADHWPSLGQRLRFLGRNTLAIYLMSSLAMGLVRALVLMTWGWNGWHFFLVAPAMLAAGLLLPIVAQRWVFARWPWTDRITR